MSTIHKGRQSVVFPHGPVFCAAASAAGRKETEGPLGGTFDLTFRDNKLGEKSWEKAETRMQQLTLHRLLEKAGCTRADIDVVFAGDLLNQCIGSSFALRSTGLPVLGLYGACSTMAEGLLLAAAAVEGGFADRAVALTSSHVAASERQYRFPLNDGGQRTPTAQWTVTGCGAALLRPEGEGPRITSATIGTVEDKGVCDATIMGAAMAWAAYRTIRAHFSDLGGGPEDYDLIVTGDLGKLGSDLLRSLFAQDGWTPGARYTDCGLLIFDRKAQDVHCGGSGCGCSASVLCGYLWNELTAGRWKRLLFCGTGALLSPVSVQQKESIPAVCHAVAMEGCGLC